MTCPATWCCSGAWALGRQRAGSWRRSNLARTLTLCNGVCGRGVLGAVRCLTDGQLRDHNEAYLAERFGDSRRFGLLLRVPVLRGNTLTPDLNNPNMRLYEWPEG